VQHVRVDHDSQRQLLQVHQLRDDIRLRLMWPLRHDTISEVGSGATSCRP